MMATLPGGQRPLYRKIQQAHMAHTGQTPVGCSRSMYTSFTCVRSCRHRRIRSGQIASACSSAAQQKAKAAYTPPLLSAHEKKWHYCE